MKRYSLDFQLPNTNSEIINSLVIDECTQNFYNILYNSPEKQKEMFNNVWKFIENNQAS